MKINKLLFGMFFILIISFVTVTAIMPNRHTKSAAKPTEKAHLDITKEFPLKEGEKKEDTGDKDSEIYNASLVTKGINKIKKKTQAVEEKYRNKVTSDYRYEINAVLLKNYYQKMLGMDMTLAFNTSGNSKSEFYDIVEKFKENPEYLGGIVDDIDISSNISNLIEFNKYAHDQGINLVYFQAPGKYLSNELYEDHSEKKNNELFDELRKNNVDYIDFNDHMPKDKNEYLKMFYRTDHHWLTSTALSADKVLCQYMNDNYGYNIDTSVFDIQNYDIVRSDVPFMGSWGRKVTEVYTEPDAFDIYYPKYETDLKVYKSSDDSIQYGSIADTLFNYRALEKPMYKRINYALYGYGDVQYCSIHNNNINDGHRVLIIKSSFADCMFPYLAAAAEDIDVVDLRYFKGSIKSLIEKNRPDTIAVVYGITLFGRSDSVKAFDFR